MLSYEDFKEVIKKQMLNLLPEEYQEMVITSSTTTKVNVTLDSLIFKLPNDEIAPTIHLNYVYDDYINSGDIDEVLNNMVAILIKSFENKQKINTAEAFDLDKLYVRLINTKGNEELLKKIPHLPFMDMSIICSSYLGTTDDSTISSIRITNKHISSYNMSEKDLFLAAIENTKKIFPPTIKPMKEVILKILSDEGFSNEYCNQMLPKESLEMYVISNESGINGATSVIYKEVLEDLANIVNSDFYILPSSIHEMIAVPNKNLDSSNNSPETLSNIVQEINGTQVALEERLSNEVYFYDKKLKKILKVSDSKKDTL